jgi:CheY-like chemotaxis protein
MADRVLIVDDDPAFRRLAARMLTDAGLVVAAEAGDAEAGLAAAHAERPDAILVDVRLPDRDGVALAQELVALPWKPRVVLTSSDFDALSLGTADLRPPVPFLPKGDLPSAPLRALFAA